MAVILALSMGVSLVTMTATLVYATVRNGDQGLSGNGTLVLTTAFSGIFGVLGAYVGMHGRRSE